MCEELHLTLFPALSVERFVHVAQLSIRDVRVDLRGGDAGVAQERLHRTQVRTTHEEISGEGMPKRVRYHAFVHQASQLGVFFYQPLNTPGREPH